MALREKTLFLYGFEVTDNNKSLDFRAVSGGPILLATLTTGFYSLTSLAAEITAALMAADPSNTYICSINRNISGGLQNRVTISTNGVYFDLLFSTGPRAATSCRSLIGFNLIDYTGALTYTGASSAGTALLTDFVVYSYLPPEMNRRVFGSVNVSVNGQKEAIAWNIQKFMSFNIKYEPETKVKTDWANFLTWAIQMRPFEITPEFSTPATFYPVTLETTGADGKGLAYRMTEMLPSFPFLYESGAMTFRVIE